VVGNNETHHIHNLIHTIMDIGVSHDRNVREVYMKLPKLTFTETETLLILLGLHYISSDAERNPIDRDTADRLIERINTEIGNANQTTDSWETVSK